MTRQAYTAIMDDKGNWRLAIVKENEQGYYPMDPMSDTGAPFTGSNAQSEAKACAQLFNDRLEISAVEAMRIVLSTI